MKKLYNSLLPKHARLPLALVVGFNCFVFWLIPLLQGECQRYDLSISADKQLPFIPAFIVVYILSYVQWVLSYLYHCRESRELCYRMTTTDLIAKSITMVFFLLLPTQILRPEITGEGIFEQMTQFIYSMDKPISLFPSIHCLESWLCFRTACMMQKKNAGYIITQLVFTLLVLASVVLVKQHFVVDIPAGIAVVEIGLFAYKKWGKTHLFEKLQLSSVQ